MIIVRYEGPSGAPGMPEMLDPTSRITTLCRERGIVVGLMTDTRFSGGSVGHVIGSAFCRPCCNFRCVARVSFCNTTSRQPLKRFAKRQQMQWAKPGAHLLLQTRPRTLDGTLRLLFELWCPGLANDNGNQAAQSTAA